MNLLWAFNFSPSRNDKGEEARIDIYDYAEVSTNLGDVGLHGLLNQLLPSCTLGTRQLPQSLQVYYYTSQSRACQDDKEALCGMHTFIRGL